MTGQLRDIELTLDHAFIDEAAAERLLAGHRVRRGERVMDPKAQLVGELIVRLSPPDYLPSPE